MGIIEAETSSTRALLEPELEMAATDEESQLPKGTKLSSLRYNSPLFQVILIGFVCFCLPGMFNALTSMGAGSQVNKQAANDSNTALYATFAIFGVLGGGIYNILGPQITLFLGSSFYVLFAGSYLYADTHGHGSAFVVTAGGLLGFGAGLLWAGQGAIMMSYPPENSKGRYISIFWSIFNMGAMLGGFLPFGLNYNRKAGTVNTGTYIGFMSVMACGVLLSLSLLPPNKVIRNDGTRVSSIKYSNVLTEGWEILKLFRNPNMLMLVPACVASNFFYTYQFNNFNAALFDVRTRGFNNVFYWGAQMIGATLLGTLLDNWAGGFAKQLQYSRHDPLPELDFKDSGAAYAGPFVLYFCYGLLDAMFQTLIYWTMGALTDNAQVLSRYSGFYKGVQSAGAAVAWQLDSRLVGFMPQLITNWVLLVVSIPLLSMLMNKVKDSSQDEDVVAVVVDKDVDDNGEMSKAFV